MPHPTTAVLRPSTWSDVPLVFVDALDWASQQDDRTRSRLASLDVLASIGRIPHPRRPRVVVYSTDMTEPAVNIPLRGAQVADAFYDTGVLIEQLGGIVAGRYDEQVPPPASQDWAALHPELPHGADVAGAHQAMRTNDRAWKQVWDRNAAFDKAAQMFVKRNVLPMLRSQTAGYRVAVEVVRKVAGLPRVW